LPVLDSAGHFRPIIPVGWTLTFEFLFYLFFAAALALRTEVLRVVAPALGLFAVLALLRTRDWPDWTILFDTIVLEFVFGVILAKLTLRGFRVPTVLAGILVVAGFAAILILRSDLNNLRVLIWGLPALAIVAGSVSLEAQLAMMLPRWLRALGDASYSIYLSHGFVLPALGILIGGIGWSGFAAEGLTVAACLIVSSIVGWVVFVLIENPMLKMLKRNKKTAK
jgi:exopolysaccharide production protein ExoZ